MLAVLGAVGFSMPVRGIVALLDVILFEELFHWAITELPTRKGHSERAIFIFRREALKEMSHPQLGSLAETFIFRA